MEDDDLTDHNLVDYVCLPGNQGCRFGPGTREFPTMKVTPDYFHKKKGRKVGPQQIPSCLIPGLLVVFTQKLEILATALDKQ